MRAPLAAADVARFRTLVGRRLGLVFDDGRLDFLAEVLRQRLEVTRVERAGDYLEALDDARGAEPSALAQQLTVGETYFFRNRDQLRACIEMALPERLRALAGARPARLLSAGCASGEEPYSLAMLAREHGATPVEILGIDLNPAAIAQARRGRYSEWSLRETPPPLRARYFRSHDDGLELAAELRAAVRFEERNLVDEAPDFWRAGAFDVIFCRNVLMYLSPEQARAVVARMARALAPGGFLFLGHAETLRDLSDEFHLRHTHGTFYYQSLAADERPEPPAPPSDDWADRIGASAARVTTLCDAAAPPAPAAAAATASLLELMGQERFAEALAQFDALPATERASADAQLLHALLLSHNGELGPAQAACDALAAGAPGHAGARYLMALLSEQLGDNDAARAHDRAAAALDPRFAMPHLHLGLLLRRAGERGRAHDELARALALLPAEDETRVRLFGGGFGRAALLELCRAELRATELHA